MSVELPDKIVLQVTYSEPGLKGDTATRTLKPAKVETGATVNVPLFVNEGEMIRVNTKTGEDVEIEMRLILLKQFVHKQVLSYR